LLSPRFAGRKTALRMRGFLVISATNRLGVVLSPP